MDFYLNRSYTIKYIMSTNMQIEISETPDQNTIETEIESMVDDLNNQTEVKPDEIYWSFEAIRERGYDPRTGKKLSIEVPPLLLRTIAAWAEAESHNIHKEKTYNRNKLARKS